ncbi:MAG: hypothetical protein AAB391_01075 [Patescibacteria group bacterium]
MNKLNKLPVSWRIIIAACILGGFYYSTEVSKQKYMIEKQDGENLVNLKLTLQKECREEKEEDIKFFDKSTLSPELIMIGLKNKGYVDDSGNFINDDIWIRDCVERKLEIIK